MPTYASFAALLLLCAVLTVPVVSQEKAEEMPSDEIAVQDAVKQRNGVWKMIGHQADNYPVWVDIVDR
jgi:hypothetical protein